MYIYFIFIYLFFQFSLRLTVMGKVDCTFYSAQLSSAAGKELLHDHSHTHVHMYVYKNVSNKKNFVKINALQKLPFNVDGIFGSEQEMYWVYWPEFN